MQANLLAATSADPNASGQIYNVAAGGRMSLNELYAILRDLTMGRHPELTVAPPVYQGFRPGDVRHAYRLTIRPERPDFRVVVVPDTGLDWPGMPGGRAFTGLAR